MWVTKDEIQRGVEVKNTTPMMALHRPCSVNGAKLQPTCMWQVGENEGDQKKKNRQIVGREHNNMHLTSGAAAASVNYQDKG